MRINLIHFVQNLATTTIPRIIGRLGLKNEPGNCALGLNMLDMMKSCPDKYDLRPTDNFIYIRLISDLHWSSIEVIGQYLGLTYTESWEIIERSDRGMPFKELSIWVRDNLLTDEERKLLKKLNQEPIKIKKDAEVLCLK